MKIKKLIPWIPGILSVVLGVVFCIVYSVINGEKITMYFQLTISSLLPLAVPIYNLIAKKSVSVVFAIAYAVFVVFASYLGSGLGFYNRFYCWDLIMHGSFGFLCSVTFFTLLVQWNGSKLNPVGFLIIVFVFTMGVAALWEVFEYSADRLLGGDAQRVQESIALGKSPVADTMEDIMIAMAGSALFFLTLLIDKFNRFRVYFRLSGFHGFGREKDGDINADGV